MIIIDHHFLLKQKIVLLVVNLLNENISLKFTATQLFKE